MQNDGDEVIFKLTKHDDTSFVFENQEHDFPQRIIYINEGEDTMHARIEDMQRKKQVDFIFNRDI